MLEGRFIRAPLRLMAGLWRRPVGWRLWVGLLVAANVVGPLFFLDQWEARLVLWVMALNAALMTLLTGVAGFTRILGAAHFPWFVMIGVLLPRLGAIPAGTAFAMWLRATLVLNAISLVIDVVDVGRYIAGDRAEPV